MEDDYKMNEKNGSILRTIPVNKFNSFLIECNKKYNINNYDLLIQENVIKDIDNKYNLNFKIISAGKFNLIRGLKYFSFFKYDNVIIPVNTFELEEYANLLFFSLPIMANNKYIIIYPDNSQIELDYLNLIFKLIVYSIVEIIIFIILILAIPFLFLNIIFNRLRYKFVKKY